MLCFQRIGELSVLKLRVPLIFLAVSFVCGAAEAGAPLSFSPSQNGLNLVETLRDLAALSLYGCCIKPTGAALSLHG